MPEAIHYRILLPKQSDEGVNRYVAMTDAEEPHGCEQWMIEPSPALASQSDVIL